MTRCFASRPTCPRKLRGAALALVALAAFARPGHGQQDTVIAEAAVELDILNGPAEIVPALVFDGTMLLPVHQFFQLAEIRVLAFALNDSLVAVLEPLDRMLRFHPDRGALLIGDTAVALAPYDAVWWDGDLFARPEVLERALGVAIEIDWMALSAQVGRTGGLPVVRRERRERRRTWLASGVRPPALELTPAVPTAGGAVFNWAFAGSSGASADYYTLDLGLGGQLFGGNMLVQPSVWTLSGRNGSEFRASWERAWPQREWVKQVRIGDVQSNGRRAQLVRGAAVTNAPFVRSSEFDVEQIVGSLPPGWEVELYDRGRLLGYGTVDAVGAFQLPLDVRYGQNPFELVMYGPTGEVMRQKRTIRVPFSRLPAGRFEYAAALGQCRYGPCDGMLSTDARYGISRRVTVQGGLDVFDTEPGGTLWQPYAAASAALLRSVIVTGEAVVNGHLRAGANFEPSTDLRITLGHTEFAEAGRAFSGAFPENRRTEATAFWRPGAMRGSLYLQALAFHSVQATTTRTITRVSASAQLGMVRYTTGLRHDAVSRDTVGAPDRFAADFSADAILPLRNRWLAGTNVRGELSVEPAHGLAAAAFTAGRVVERAVRADLGVAWFRGAGWGFTLALTTTLPGPRFGVRSQANTAAGTTGLLFANGSAVYDTEQQRVHLTDGADLGRAGVTGTIYADANGNGVQDPDESGIPDVYVHVGGRRTRTDPAGRFAVWDLLPFEAVDVVVDSLSLPDPRMVPSAPLLQVRPTPNSYVPIAVPVVIGAEVLGYVVLDGEGVGGITVILRDLETGAEVTTTTFSDGAFYQEGVPPGEYEIVLPERVMRQLGLYAAPLHLFVPPGAGEKRVEDLVVQLERLPG